MTADIRNLLDEYTAWLKDKTMIREVDEWFEITTPYLDRHNDYLQIYAKRENGDYLLTDGGYILEDLQSSGCKLDNKKRQDLLHITLNGFGIQLANNTLSVRASANNFALRKHNLLQAMLAVNDLFYLAMPITASLFLEDLTTWLDLHNVRYIPSVKLVGKGGLDYMFDFAIPKSKSQPERILKAINRPNNDNAKVVAFSWIDTRDNRPTDSRAYAFLNDSEYSPTPSVLDTLKSYSVKPILWSEREKVRPELVD